MRTFSRIGFYLLSSSVGVVAIAAPAIAADQAASPAAPAPATETVAVIPPAPAPSPAAAPAASFDNDVIVVTANKREQAQNSVGLTIQAASGDDLVQRGITSPADLGKLIPGFTFTQSLLSTPVYTLRGIGFYDPTFGAAPAVAIYTDEVPRNAPVSSDALDLDITRVEVLKGPQGTLFGQSSTGGAINYVVGKPTKSLHFGGQASYERFGLASLEGYISGPVSDWMQVRLAAKAQSGGAWQYSLSRPEDRNGDTRKVEGRLTVDIEPTPDFKIELMATGARDRSDPQAPQYTGSLFNTFPTAAAAAAAGDPYAVIDPAAYAALTDPASPGFYPNFAVFQATLLDRLHDAIQTPNDAALQAGAQGILGTPIVKNNSRAADWTDGLLTPSDNPYYQFIGRMDYNLSPTITLTSLTTLARKGEQYNQSLTGTVARDVNVALFGNVRSFNQELRLSGNTDRMHWIVGATYDNIRSSQNNYYFLQDYSGNAGGLISVTFNQIDTSAKSYAVFGNVEYKLSDRLTAQGGIRYTDNKQSATYCYSDPAIDTVQGTSFIFGQFLNSVPINILPGQCFPTTGDLFLGTAKSTLVPVHETLNKGNVSFRLGLDYKLDGGTLLYATLSQGYKAGVFSAIGASRASQYTPAVQERLRAYEVGFKAPLLDRRVQLNAAAFYYDYANKQTEAFVQDFVFGPLEKLVNVPKSYVYGVEAELTARIMNHLRIAAGATYLKTKVTSDFSRSADGVPIFNTQNYTGNFKGSELPYTPKFSGNIDAQYDMPISSSVNAFVGGTVVYLGKQNGTFGTAVLLSNQFEIPGYTTLDLRAGVSGPDGRWKAEIYGRNVTNTVYTTSVSEYHDASIRFLGKPAVYGFSLTFKY